MARLEYVTQSALFVADPNTFVLRVSGVVNVVVGSVPIADAVEVGTFVIPATVNVCPGNAEPSTTVPLAFVITLQTLIKPLPAVIGAFAVSVIVQVFAAPAAIVPEQSDES